MNSHSRGGGFRRSSGPVETRFWWRETWLTGIVDLANSDLIEMVCGRSSQTLRDWVAGLTDTERAGVTTVVIDFHAEYRAAISEAFPTAVIVGDRFHFEQLGGRAVIDVRRRRIFRTSSSPGPQDRSGLARPT